MIFLKKIILFWSFLLSIFFSFSYAYAEDALDQVLGVGSEAGNYQVINDETEVEEMVSSNNSLIIRSSKLMLKFAVIIWVFVFLIWGIRFLLSFGDDSKAKKVRDNLLIAMLWFVIAFWSWVILQVILSIWPSITWG